VNEALLTSKRFQIGTALQHNIIIGNLKRCVAVKADGPSRFTIAIGLPLPTMPDRGARRFVTIKGMKACISMHTGISRTLS
jgi:hypothetical protein